MEATGHIMHGGTIADATIISAPSSTKMQRRNGIRKCIRPKRKYMEILDEMPHLETVGILELRNGMRSKTTNIFVRLIFASIAVRKACRKYLIMRLTGNVILKTENPLHSFVACVPSSIIQDHIDECAKSMTNMIYRICFPCYSRQQHN